MKVLIYMPFADWIPHLATDLEIAVNHLERGDEVHIIQCSGDLPFCEPNPNHLKLRCMLCMSRRNKGLKIINLPENNRHELALGSYYRNLKIPEFSSLQELKDFKVDNVDVGMAVVSSLVSMVRESNPDLRLYKNFIDKNLSMAIAVYDAITHHLKEINPDVFYLFNGRFVPLRPALRAAQDLGVKTYVHERSGVLQRYSLTEDTYPHDIIYQKEQIERRWKTEYSFEKKENIAIKWFEDRRGGKDQGWFSFTKSQLKGNLPEGFDFEKRNIVIYISSEDEFESITGWQNPIYKNQVEALRKILKSDLDRDIVLYLRIHPNLKGLKNTQAKELSGLKALNLVVIPAESKIDSYQLMYGCEKVITFGSTMGIESVFWGKPSVLAGRSLYEGLGGCYIPKTHEELVDLINRRLEPKEKVRSLKYAYWQATNGCPYKYYEPESVRGGKFMGVYLKNPVLDRIKAKILAHDVFYRMIFNFAFFARTVSWKLRRII